MSLHSLPVNEFCHEINFLLFTQAGGDTDKMFTCKEGVRNRIQKKAENSALREAVKIEKVWGNYHTFFSIFTDILKGVGGLKGVDFQNFL